MGACTSVQKDPDSPMRCRLGLVSRAKRIFVSSPAKGRALNRGSPFDRFGFQSPGFESSKDEIFFDSQAWLDSDCEDDFLSVNGEFTPSGGSTPNHQINSPMTPQFHNHFPSEKYPDSKSEPSPTGRKKLAELLHETLQSEKVNAPNAAEARVDSNVKPDIYKTNTDQPQNSANATLHHSGACSIGSSEVTPNRDLKSRKAKTWKTGHCCLPSLQSFGFDERRL
ncbi:hypothetical protein B296_00057076 [Ensete ventricosum]|uniref:Uncharacterized protein n=1 Tax=Ensete ventricosum TaxID=4639 RepID=A0A426X1C7_ENSVE|nr:hypothetical protein B296_00057076 [Ensete ventricosum]